MRRTTESTRDGRPAVRGAGSRIALALLLIALLARAVLLLATPGYAPHGDDRDYLRLGAAIARTGAYPTGHVWVTDHGCPPVRGLPRTPCVAAPHAPGARLVARPTAYRPPAYPYALALPELLARWTHGNAVALARCFQALIGVLDAALVGLLAALLFGRRVGLIALGLAAVYLPLVVVSGTLISEPLYVAFTLGALCAVVRWRERGGLGMLVLAGGLAGLCALTRTNGVLVVLALVVAVLAAPAGRRGVSGAVLLLAVAALTVTPWLVRDRAVFGRVVAISTEGGGTLLGTWNPTSQHDRREPAAWLGLSHLAGYGLMYREQSAHPEPVIDAALRKDAVAFATAHPGYAWTVLSHNTVRLLDLEGLSRARFSAGTVGIPAGPAVAAAAMFYLVGLVALIGRLVVRSGRMPWWLWLLVALQFASTVFVNTETPRFRTPLEPFVLLLAACTLDRLLDASVRVRSGRRAAPAAAASARA